MNAKEIITISISAVLDVILTFVLSQVLTFETGGIVSILFINLVLLVSVCLWFSKKLKKQEEKNVILNDMGITTEEDLRVLKEKKDILNDMGIVTEKNLRTLKDLHRNLDLLGIENCTDKLTDTPFAPKTCMKKVTKTLYFMGVAGSKWVIDPPSYKAFELMLSTVDAAQGEVHFLLLNPEGDGWKKLKKLRQDNLSDDSYDKYRKLMSDYDCLKVRLYDPLPSFRLQFVDEKYLAISRYKFVVSAYEKDHYGWDAPHLIVESEQQILNDGTTKHFWSLYMAFQLLYEYVWNLSKELKP